MADNANVFDQFDTPVTAPAGGNVFDQFDGPNAVADYNPAHTAAGLGELGLQAVTGGAAQIVGGLRGLATLATTGDSNAAADAVKSTESAMTYQPRTQMGKQYAQDLATGVDTLANKQQAALERAGAGPGITTLVPALEQGAAVVIPGARGASVAADAGEAAARSVASTARKAVDTVKGGDIPEGTTFDRAGIAQSPDAPAASTANTFDQFDADANVPGATAAKPPVFTEPPPPKAAVEPAAEAEVAPATPAEQAQRSATLKEVGLDEARTSAVAADKGAAATDYQTSKLDTEGGKAAAEAFGNERTALGNYMDQRVAEAGGTSGLDETALYNRGQAIVKPLQAFSDDLDGQITDLYKAADAQAQGLPSEMTTTGQVLGNRSQFVGTQDGQALLRGVNAYLREAGVADEGGGIGNMTAQQAERFRQYLGSQWTPGSGRLIAQLKDAIDEDVTRNAGGKIYAEARAARTLRAKLLDDPKGIASLLENSGPGGINRSVNVERVPDTLQRMPVDQFNHVVTTLEAMRDHPNPALRAPAQTALNEVRSQLMLRLEEQSQKQKGAWNNRGVSQYLNANNAKIARVFSKAEIQRLQTLNEAGHILDVDRTYPGAAVQSHNLAMRGAIKLLEHGPAYVGAHIAGPVGAVAGELAGKVGAKALESAASKKGWQKRMTKL